MPRCTKCGGRPSKGKGYTGNYQYRAGGVGPWVVVVPAGQSWCDLCVGRAEQGAPSLAALDVQAREVS